MNQDTNDNAYLSPDYEPQLLQEMAGGSADAFAILYKRYQPKLSRFLYPFRNIEDPKEIIQDIFLKIWEKREALAAIRSFEQYLYRMAKNRLIDLQRSNAARGQRESKVQGNKETGSDPAFQETEYKEVHAYAFQAILELPDRQQTIYRLRIFEDYSLDEISEKMFLSKAVVTKQLYLATCFVREKLKKYQHSDLPLTIGLSLILQQLFF